MIYYSRDSVIVRDATELDAREVAANLRSKDAQEVLASGFKTEGDAVEYSFCASSLCLAVEREGVPVAVFGIVPGRNAQERSQVWFLGTDGLSKMKKTFVTLSHVIIETFLRHHPVLINWVDARYTETVRWLECCGATFEDPMPLTDGGIPFRKFVLRGE